MVLSLALLTISACGKPTGSAGNDAKAWVGKTSTSAFMIQMTRADHALTGTLDEASIGGAGETDVKPEHLAFTGTVQEHAMTLSFPLGFGAVTTIAGTLTESAMTLQIPQDDGTVAAVELRPGTVGDYNSDVAALHAGADANATRQAQVAADEQEADRLRSQQAEITSAADTVATDRSTLEEALTKPPSFENFETHLREAEDHLAETKKYAAAAGRQSDPYDACNTAYDAQNSAYDVANSGYDIATDVSDLSTAIGDVDGAADKLEADLSAYKDAASGLPGFAPANAPDAGQVADTLQAAARKIAGWRASGKSYERQAAALTKKANDIAEAANKKYCE
ncbi:hypothetical protein [Nucisporomicrobium flavum]|uniref:hypothetical protein n=1 Tax=Nucisporomicrobium flavum TaxID=2785915 RepID=UPI0018F5C654|nr:hypothetical protein [Nucisporomicrobium flavum]